MRNVERWVTETFPVERGSNQLIRKIMWLKHDAQVRYVR